jgi:hypothetical protein
MSHRKKEHPNMIKPCSQFQQNNCRFKSKSCWFKHEEDVSEDEIENKENKNSKKFEESQTVFQKVSEDLYPPIVKTQENLQKSLTKSIKVISTKKKTGRRGKRKQSKKF